jgi:hypothetical protein
MSWFLLLIIVAVALGLIGFVVKGLFWLLIIGIAVFLIDLVAFGAFTGRRRSRKLTR